jgi:hypothetical protein
VRLVPALEAEIITTLATHVHNSSVLIDNAVVTAGERAPPYLFVVISVALAEPLLISLQVVSG